MSAERRKARSFTTGTGNHMVVGRRRELIVGVIDEKKEE
jgi:hypothetical protein